MKKIILISGKIKSGKDECAQYLVDYYREQGLRAIILKYASPLKIMCAALIEMDVNMMDDRTIKNTPFDALGKLTPRQWQIAMSKQMKSIFGYDYFGQLMVHQITSVPIDQHDVIIISDWRFPEEGEYVNNHVPKEYEVIKIRLTRSYTMCTKLVHELASTFLKQHKSKKLDEQVTSSMALRDAYNIINDVSETALDKHEQTLYFDLTLPNPYGDFEITKRLLLEFLTLH